MQLSVPVSILIALIRAYMCSVYQHVCAINFACMTGQMGVAQAVPAVTFSTRGGGGQDSCHVRRRER